MIKQAHRSSIPNLLLASLDADERSSVLDGGEIVTLDLKRVLHEPGEPTPHVYFPLSGVISLLTVLEDGSAVEMATVGNEGMVDLPAYLGLESSALWLVQVPGEAVRLETETLRRLASSSTTTNGAMHRYLLSMFVLVSQTAACNRRHSIEQRCARWLLMTHDRVKGDCFPLTHEFLADMLGVRRPSVSIAMSYLREAGFAHYRHGMVEIIDREGLERATCECYRVLTQQFENPFPNNVVN